MEISIVYEDDTILAINKPSGIAVHGAEGESLSEGVGGTVARWVLARYPEMAKVGESMETTKGTKILRPGIVHRLDKGTSGILILTKTQSAFEFLKKAFQERTIEKEYKAIVHGEIKDKKGVIMLPIGRNPKDFRRKSTHETARGKIREAETDYSVDASAGGMSFVTIFPKTGRMHQIRVHMNAIGHPVVCDELYAPGPECPLELGRLALHAYAISFDLPPSENREKKSGRIRLEAPLAEDIERFAKTKFPSLRLDE